LLGDSDSGAAAAIGPATVRRAVGLLRTAAVLAVFLSACLLWIAEARNS
jgi:hypothetical protein